MLRQSKSIQGRYYSGIWVNESGQDQSFGLDATYEDEVWIHKYTYKTGRVTALGQCILEHVKSED